MTTGLLLTVLMGAVAASDVAVPSSDIESLKSDLSRAERDSDLELALALMDQFKHLAAQEPKDDNYLLLGRASLVAAEVRRYAYEKGKGMDPRDRRLLGRTIDEVAKIGHDALDEVSNQNSEKWRMKADLYGTMIRSNYKGNKYVNEMDSATEKAIALDPNNPNAILTATKRPLFAEEQYGGNTQLALELLNRALEIDPNFERAVSFRGVAYEKLGQTEKAIAEWKHALELNPKSRLAADKLEEHDVS